jgi:hypothetical protein
VRGRAGERPLELVAQERLKCGVSRGTPADSGVPGTPRGR